MLELELLMAKPLRSHWYSNVVGLGLQKLVDATKVFPTLPIPVIVGFEAVVNATSAACALDALNPIARLSAIATPNRDLILLARVLVLLNLSIATLLLRVRFGF